MSMSENTVPMCFDGSEKDLDLPTKVGRSGVGGSSSVHNIENGFIDLKIYFLTINILKAFTGIYMIERSLNAILRKYNFK